MSPGENAYPRVTLRCGEAKEEVKACVCNMGQEEREDERKKCKLLMIEAF